MLVLVPGHPYTLFAVTSSGLRKSTDEGATWSEISIRSGSTVYEISDLAFDPANPSRLFATGAVSCWCEDEIPRLFRSEDSGETWSMIATVELLPTFGRIVVGGQDSPVLYTAGIGVLKSTDGGANWVPSGLQNLTITGLALDRRNPSVLYAATARGVFKSTDAGGTWQPTGSN